MLGAEIQGVSPDFRACGLENCIKMHEKCIKMHKMAGFHLISYGFDSPLRGGELAKLGDGFGASVRAEHRRGPQQVHRTARVDKAFFAGDFNGFPMDFNGF